MELSNSAKNHTTQSFLRNIVVSSVFLLWFFSSCTLQFCLFMCIHQFWNKSEFCWFSFRIHLTNISWLFLTFSLNFHSFINSSSMLHKEELTAIFFIWHMSLSKISKIGGHFKFIGYYNKHISIRPLIYLGVFLIDDLNHLS